MTRWERVRQAVVHTSINDLIGLGVSAATTASLLPHSDPLLASLAGQVLGQTAQAGLQAWQDSPRESPPAPPVIARYAPIADPTMSPGFFAYTVKTEWEQGVYRVHADQIETVFAPYFPTQEITRLWLQHAVHADIIEGPVIHNDLSLVAWGVWCDQRAVLGPPPPILQPIGPYVTATAPTPATGWMAWRPLLTLQGVQYGVLTDTEPYSLTGAPFITRRLDTLTQMFHEGLPTSRTLLLDYLPLALADQLIPTGLATTGPHVFRRQVPEGPRIQPSVPYRLGFSAPDAPETAQALDTQPAWYVSVYGQHGETFAWQRADDQHIVVLLTQHDGTPWQPAHWNSVSEALNNFAQHGLWAQEHPAIRPVAVARALHLPAVLPPPVPAGPRTLP